MLLTAVFKLLGFTSIVLPVAALVIAFAPGVLKLFYACHLSPSELLHVIAFLWPTWPAQSIQTAKRKHVIFKPFADTFISNIQLLFDDLYLFTVFLFPGLGFHLLFLHRVRSTPLHK